VEEAVAALGYEHRRSASHPTGTLAVIIPDTMNTYFHAIAQGIEEQAVPSGMVVSLVLLREEADYVSRLLRWLTRGSCDGVIYCSSSRSIGDQELIDLHAKAGIAVVLINRSIDHPTIPSVRIDLEDAMYRATRHLLGLDHRRIAFLAGPANSASSVEKWKGVERALRETSLRIPEALRLGGRPNVEWGFLNTTTLLELPAAQRPTAVLASNDLLALGAMHACRARRVQVPDDISVVGFDDVPMAAHANPPLTTIAAPKQEMGRLAVRMIEQIRTRGEADLGHYTMMESPLVVRESTAVCRTP
jgi:DNA-binding LacI/PurR family transcriptional regulator